MAVLRASYLRVCFCWSSAGGAGLRHERCRPALRRTTVSIMNAPEPGAHAGHAADTAASRDPPGQARLAQLAEEQAALRRVATLVAGGAQPAEVFSAVADELGRLIGAEATFVTRVAHTPGERGKLEGHITVVGSYGRVSDQVPVGFRIKLQPGMIHTAALQMGRLARINGEQLATGPFGAIVGKLGLRAAVATPIAVGGRNWGVTVAATSREDFPAGTESRMADFMELAATAIANARAEEKLRELADTQAALRRGGVCGGDQGGTAAFRRPYRRDDPVRVGRDRDAARQRRPDRRSRPGRRPLGGQPADRGDRDRAAYRPGRPPR